MPRELRDFKEIWIHDFEYQANPGEHVIPHCLVAHELRSGRRLRLWRDRMGSPPYRLDSDVSLCRTTRPQNCLVTCPWAGHCLSGFWICPRNSGV